MKRSARLLTVLMTALLLVTLLPLPVSSARPRTVAEDGAGIAGANRYPVSLDDPTSMDALRGVCAADATEWSQFGSAVDIDGDRVAIGAPGENSGAGAVYILERDGLDWVQTAKLVSTDPGDYEFFGKSVAMAGDYLAVGEYRDSGGGAVHIFTRDPGGNWVHQTKIKPADSAASDAFGYSVDLYGGSLLAVGAYYGDGSGGRAYVYTGSFSTWSKLDEVTGQAASDDFGWSVAIDHNTLVVGAPRNDSPGFDAGAAYVYVRSGDLFPLQQKLVAADQADSDYFGWDVDVVDDTALVGAKYDDDLGNISGSVYEFERSGVTWTQDEKLTPDDGDDQDAFGTSVAFDGMTAVVGAPGTSAEGDHTGSAYVFTRSAGDWSELKRLDADEPEEDAWFGWDVDVDGASAIVGAAEADAAGEDSGEAYTVDSYYYVDEDGTLTVDAPGLLANDYDLDGNPVSVHGLVSEAEHGEVSFAADGSFSYTPDPDFKGYDSFTYRDWDGLDYSETTRVNICVQAVHDYVSIAGDTRFATGAEAALAAFPEGSDWVVLATGRNFPDALGGSALAGALEAPLLLVDTASVPADVVSAITDLGAKHAIILGGDSAVDPAVEPTVLAAMGGGSTIERIAGSNRYDTARKVAARTVDEIGGAYAGGAFVATGRNFPDALAAGPVAASAGWPIYLVSNTPADATTIQAMEDSGAEAIEVVGGESVVTPTTYASLVTNFGAAAVARLAGSNRYETASFVSQLGVEEAGMQWDGVGIATGVAFPDALSAGAMLGARSSVLLLSKRDVLPGETQGVLQDWASDIDDVFFFGGPAALSDNVRTAVRQAIEGP